MKNTVQKTIVPGVVFLIVGLLFWLLTPGQVPTNETSGFTAQTFPRISLGIVMLCSAGLILSGTVQLLRDKKKSPATAAEDTPARMQKREILRVAAVLALLLLAAVVGSVAGLLVAGLILGLGTLLIYKVRKKHHYLLVAAIVAASYFLFKYLFTLNLP